MRGYIKLYRQIAENAIWLIKPFSEGQAWVDLLCISTFDKGLNAPNPNNIFNPIVREFQKKMKEILNYSIRLSGVQCDKVVELNQRIDDFSATIPTVLERLKKIQWNFDDGSIVNADIDWLLKNENYVSVLSGKFTSKAEIIKNWKPKGERDYER